MSGVTVTTMDFPNSDGPVNGGASWLFIVQLVEAALIATVSATVTVRVKRSVRFICQLPLLGPVGSMLIPCYFGSPKFPNSMAIFVIVLTARPVWSCP